MGCLKTYFRLLILLPIGLIVLSQVKNADYFIFMCILVKIAGISSVFLLLLIGYALKIAEFFG